VGKSVKRRHALGRQLKLAKNLALAALVVIVVSAGVIFAVRELNREQPLSSKPEAQRLYDLAGYIAISQTPNRQFQAFTNLSEAVKLDPQFADAYFRISQLYFGPGGEQLPPHSNFVENIQWVAAKLREWDPDSAVPHDLQVRIGAELAVVELRHDLRVEGHQVSQVAQNACFRHKIRLAKIEDKGY